MIKSFIEKIIELSEAHIIHEGDYTYSDKKLYALDNDIRAEPITTNSLSSILDFVNNPDVKVQSDIMNNPIVWTPHYIHIANEATVYLISALNNDRKRECLIQAHAQIPRIHFNQFVQQEEFTINLKACFVDTDDDKDALLSTAGTVQVESIGQYSDDGITQKATVKHGVATLSEKTIDPIVRLTPYRTFLEVEQVTSEFLFRLNGRDDVRCALYESDGGAWKIEAMKRIKKYFEDNLSEEAKNG